MLRNNFLFTICHSIVLALKTNCTPSLLIYKVSLCQNVYCPLRLDRIGLWYLSFRSLSALRNHEKQVESGMGLSFPFTLLLFLFLSLWICVLFVSLNCMLFTENSVCSGKGWGLLDPGDRMEMNPLCQVCPKIWWFLNKITGWRPIFCVCECVHVWVCVCVSLCPCQYFTLFFL